MGTIQTTARHSMRRAHSDLPESPVRIWKHSHGLVSLSEQERQKLLERSVLTIYRDTGKKQGEHFRAVMQPGDYVYLCHGNDIQLFGQITSNLENPNARWVERHYRCLRTCNGKRSTYGGPKKYWAPNANSTSRLVPSEELKTFEKLILLKFFHISLDELKQRRTEESVDDSLFEMLSDIDDKKYEEGRRKLILHERMERQRNRGLVSDAKARFREKHQSPYCEVCGFNFSDKYGERGVDFIEAHHRFPISKLTSKTLMKLKDLAMVCANCHRMLHRHPWVSVEELRDVIEGAAR